MSTTGDGLVPARQRVGLVARGSTAAKAVEAIVAAEGAGVHQVWMTQRAAGPETLAILAAAAARTSSIWLGSAVIPTYPRHPLVLAQEALAVAELAPARFRLGLGVSHRSTIEGTYGLRLERPMAHLREYVGVVRALLWDGAVDVDGPTYRVRATMPQPPRLPILVSALRVNAFRLAGEISDGAISWVCPVSYLVEQALPALAVGAAAAGRRRPPLVAHLTVALSDDRPAATAAARQALAGYVAQPFYAGMFADAGFPIGADGAAPAALVDDLTISGDEAAITTRLRALLASGLDELLLMPVPVHDAEGEVARLARLIGQL